MLMLDEMEGKVDFVSLVCSPLHVLYEYTISFARVYFPSVSA